MKVLRQIAHGDVRMALKLSDDPIPAPGHGEIVVKMEVAALHGTDVWGLTDTKRVAPNALPRIGGTEGVGRVHALGESVSQFKLGQRVFPPKYGGLFREYVPCPASAVYAAPENCA
ncbi:MAG: alcohol dehydrogenase catalytic domain-containing protein, partial [Rhodospirillaceae bacterium]|nr:alcohol dehydrogenase catalytic domain-containing protein [Rhodospirillaceae bacterium]